MKNVLLFLVIICCASAGNAQEIVCRVQNKIKSSAQNATMLVTQNEQQKALITTDSNGYYATKLMVPGYYDVKIFANGCDTQIITGVMASPGKKTTLNINLTEKHNNSKTRIVSYEGRNRTIEYPMFSIYDKDIAIKTEKPIHTRTNITYIPLYFVKKAPDHLDTFNTNDKELISMLTSTFPVKKKHNMLNWLKRKNVDNRL